MHKWILFGTDELAAIYSLTGMLTKNTMAQLIIYWLFRAEVTTRQKSHRNAHQI